MRYLTLMILMALPLALPAAEAESTTGGGQTTLYALIGGAITALIGWLVAKFGLKTQPDTTPIDPKMPLNEARNFFIDKRLIPFVLSTGEHWLVTQAGPLLADALDGDGFAWKDHWSELREYVSRRTLKKFQAENQDVLEYLGNSQELDELIDRQLMKLITKLPEGVTQFIPQSLVDKLTDKAREFLAEKGEELLHRH